MQEVAVAPVPEQEGVAVAEFGAQDPGNATMASLKPMRLFHYSISYLTLLFIAHDLSVMRYISDRIAVIHKGDIVELADAEELVTHAIHPYTRSLLSAIPMPNPRLERKKKLLVYDPAMHDYTQEAPQWRELRPSHWVLCSEQEAKDWLAEM